MRCNFPFRRITSNVKGYPVPRSTNLNLFYHFKVFLNVKEQTVTFLKLCYAVYIQSP
jgi:hypothetical protein